MTVWTHLIVGSLHILIPWKTIEKNRQKKTKCLMPEILRLAHFLIHSTQLHHPTKPNMAAASLVIAKKRTFILTVAAQVEFRFIIMGSIPDLIPRMCQTSILRFHPLELEFMKDTEVLKDAYLRYEEMGQRCKRWHPVSPETAKWADFWTVHSPLQVQFFFACREYII